MKTKQRPTYTHSFFILILSLCLTALVGCRQSLSIAPTTNQPEIPFNADVITIWAEQNSAETWRIDKLQLAYSRLDKPDFQLQPQPVNVDGHIYVENVAKAGQEKQKNNTIVWSNGNQLQRWAKNGYLEPLDSCLEKHPTLYQSINPDLWGPAQVNGIYWGIPAMLSLKVLYINKKTLKEIGWTEPRIDNLPTQIENGSFTLDDLFELAEIAQQDGLTSEGAGFWPKPSFGIFDLYLAYGGKVTDDESKLPKLMLDLGALKKAYTYRQALIQSELTFAYTMEPVRNEWSTRLLWLDTISQERVLFSYGDSHDWSRWANQYVEDNGGESYLESFITVSTLPSGIKGMPPKALAVPSFYSVLKSDNRSSQKLDAICTLMSQIPKPDINLSHFPQRSALGSLNPLFQSHTSPTNTNNSFDTFFYKANVRMSQNTYFAPVKIAGFSELLQIINTNNAAIENGEITPDEAVGWVENKIENSFDYEIIVVPSTLVTVE